MPAILGRSSDYCGEHCRKRQITPRALMAATADPDPAVVKRTFEAMMGMRKIDIAAIEAARRG